MTYQHRQLTMFVVIITQNKNLEISIKDLQNSLDELSQWFPRRKLTLNSTRSETKIFTLRKYKNPTVIKINNQKIQ